MSSLGKLLKERKTLCGINVSLACPETLEIISDAGFDWAFIDYEHSAFDLADIRLILQLFKNKLFSVVRLPDQSETNIKKILDLGADGIIIPQIRSAEEVRKVLQYSKYPPQGARSVGLYRAQDYGKNFDSYISTANENVAVIALIEHIDAVNDIDNICSVPGLSAIYLGPYDLSASLGVTGKINDEKVVSAIEIVRKSALKHNLSLGIFTQDPKKVPELFETGYNFLTCGVDLVLFANAISQIASQLK